MKKPCEKCYNLRTTLSWSARPVITEYGSGLINHGDRIIYKEFYPGNEKDPNAWPVCPKCGERVPADLPENQTGDPFNLPEVDLKPAAYFLGLVFFGLLLLLFLL